MKLNRTACLVQKVSELTGNCYEKHRGGVPVGVCGSCVRTYLRRHRFPVVQPPKHLPTSISCGKLATQREGNQLTAGLTYWPSWAGSQLPFSMLTALIRHLREPFVFALCSHFWYWGPQGCLHIYFKLSSLMHLLIWKAMMWKSSVYQFLLYTREFLQTKCTISFKVQVYY